MGKGDRDFRLRLEAGSRLVARICRLGTLRRSLIVHSAVDAIACSQLSKTRTIRPGSSGLVESDEGRSRCLSQFCNAATDLCTPSKFGSRSRSTKAARYS